MNYLAHALLSFNEPQILAGNMISDFVKGKKQYDYSLIIQKGIRLHRSIDHFTDDHPLTGEIKKFFRPAYRLYAGAFADIVYDYFLANDVNEFQSPEDLLSFSIAAYQMLDSQFEQLSPGFQQFFFYMKRHNFLYSYRNQEGIRKSFAGMAHRAAYIKETDTAFRVFKNNIIAMEKCYHEFFPELKNYASYTMNNLINND